MKRIKTMLMALMTILAVGAVGASVASADGTGHIDGIPGVAVGCDFEFVGDGWVANGTGGWGTSTESVAVDCDGEDGLVSADISKDPIDPNSGLGDAELATLFSYRMFSGLVTCTYSAFLSGSGNLWHWTDHWAPSGADPDIPHGSGNINNPGDASVDDKMFHFTGTASRISGTALFCLPTFTVDVDMRDHYTH